MKITALDRVEVKDTLTEENIFADFGFLFPLVSGNRILST